MPKRRQLCECEHTAFSSAILSRAALVAEAFEAVDVNDEGFIRWEVRQNMIP